MSILYLLSKCILYSKYEFKRICILSKLFSSNTALNPYLKCILDLIRGKAYTVEVKVKASVWGRICKAVEAAKVH